MATTAFESRPLPDPVGWAVRVRLARAHNKEPFSVTDPRATVRRVRDLVVGLPVRTFVYRGGLELQGLEVDHIWLAVEHRAGTGVSYVLDAAFPLFHDGFVMTLCRFVAGDAHAAELHAAAVEAGVDERVLGMFPRPMRYRGQPVWTSEPS